MAIFDAIFGVTPGLGTGQVCARAVLIFVYGLALVRIAGRRVFGRWSALDIIVSIMIGSNLSRALTGNAPLLPTLAATTVLVLLHWLLSQAAARSRFISRIVEGRSIPLVRDGEVDTRAMKRHGVTDADLREALRGAGLERAEQVRLLALETSGRMSVLREK
jgi:uncharacterized membrane protein YcaP (DUF421 family)